MKTIFKTILACSVGLVLAGCAKEYDDSALQNDVKNLKSQIEQIQNDIRSLNGQITGLTETIEQWKKGGYVENIQELADKSGFTITFTGGKTVTLYHGAKGDPGKDGDPGKAGDPGKDGDPGTPGENGKTPSLKMDTDGIFYWTIDGPVEDTVSVHLEGRSLAVLSGSAGITVFTGITGFTGVTVFTGVTFGTVVEGYGFPTGKRDGETGFVGQFLDVFHITAFLPLFNGLREAGDLSVERADVVLDLLDLRLEILDIVLESAVVVLLGAAGEDEAHRAG